MDLHVLGDVGLAGEAFPTVGAGEWLLSSVDSLMDDEVRVAGEGDVAFRAVEDPVGFVYPGVCRQVCLVAEVSSTLQAGHLLPFVSFAVPH